MTELKFAVQEIDEQLEVLVENNTSIDHLKSLLDLRNKIILKHKPAADIDWTIQNKMVLDFLKKKNWYVHWVSPDVPI
jgi:hypothetical protein